MVHARVAGARPLGMLYTTSRTDEEPIMMAPMAGVHSCRPDMDSAVDPRNYASAAAVATGAWRLADGLLRAGVES